MSDKTGGPAFPCTEANYSDPKWTAEGISIRDYFAAKALEGLCAATSSDDVRQMYVNNANGNGIDAKEQVAKSAYGYADAMLAARQT